MHTKITGSLWCICSVNNMKILREKQISFLQKAISDTMQGHMNWDRAMSNYIDGLSAFQNVPLDPEGVFYCQYFSTLGGEFWIAMGQDGRVRGVIGSEICAMENFDREDEEIGVLLTRLFYLLFDARPSANKLIDYYLAQEHQQDSETSE